MKTTTRENVAKTAALGMYAVARHMIDRDLPAPFAITAPSPCNGDVGILVSVPSTAVDAWLDSIVVDTETASPSTVDGHQRFTYTGRLGDNGVRILVSCVRRAPALTVVPA